MAKQEWRKRKQGTPRQVGKPFPILQRSSRPTAADHFKQVLRTSGAPALFGKNPLADGVDEEKLMHPEVENKEEEVRKVMAYWRQHPELSQEEATQKALNPSTSDRVSGIMDTTKKVGDGLSRFFKRIGLTGQEEAEEKESVFETESEAMPVEQLFED